MNYDSYHIKYEIDHLKFIIKLMICKENFRRYNKSIEKIKNQHSTNTPFDF